MITEKEQKIVDAVNLFKGELEVLGKKPCVMECSRPNKHFPNERAGDLVNGGEGFSREYYKLVCTIERFDQCVKEMSEFTGNEHFTRYQAFLSYAKQNSLGTRLNRSNSDIPTKEEQATNEVLEKIFDGKKDLWENLTEICESVQTSDPVEAFADVEPAVYASTIERDQIAEMIQFAAGNSDIPLTPLVELFEKMQKANMFKYF